MRTPLKLAAAVLLTGAVGAAGAIGWASSDKPAAPIDDAFSHDLQLASATNMDLAMPKVDAALLTNLETAPRGEPRPARTIRKAAEGAHAIHSEAPSVAATPEPEPAAVDSTQPIAEAPAPAPVPEPITEPVAVAPRPQPVSAPAGGTGTGDYGRGGGGGGGGGGVFGGGIGVVIRGGGVFGDDRCEIHTRRRGGIYRSPVYVPLSRPSGPTATMPTANPRAGRITVVVNAPR